MANSSQRDASDVQWFEVDDDTDVLDKTGTPIGRLRPGRHYRAIDVTALQAVVPGPDGSVGYVASSAIRLVERPPTRQNIGAAPANQPATRRQPRGPNEPAPAAPAAHSAQPVPAAGGPPRSRMRWVAPVVALAVVAGAAGLIATDVISGDGTEGDPDDQAVDDGGARGDLDDNGSAGDQNGAVEAEPVEPAVDGAAGDQTATTEAAPDPNDLAGGLLPFRVVEASPVEGPERLEIIGFSSQFAFGFDFDTYLSNSLGATETIVIDRTTRKEVARVPTGEGVVSGVLDRGSEVWLSVVNDRKIFVFDPACVCVSREIPVGTNSVGFMIEHLETVWIGDYSQELGKAVVTAIEPSTGLVGQLAVEDDRFAASNLQAAVGVGNQLWMVGGDNAGFSDPHVWILDLTTASVEEVKIGGERFQLFAHEGSLFVVDPSDLTQAIDLSDRSYRILEGTHPSSDGSAATSAAVIDDKVGRIWVSSFVLGALRVIDPIAFTYIDNISFDGVLGQPVVSNGYVWVPVGNRLVVVDPETASVVTELPGVGPPDRIHPFSVEVVGNALWLTQRGTPRTYVLEDR